MPILPFIDLLILAGWTALLGGGVLKLIYITTTYRPTLFGIGPLDFLIIAAVFLLFSLTLAARTWVKAHETEQVRARQRANAELDRRIEMLDGVREGGGRESGARREGGEAAGASGGARAEVRAG